jgi:hypothetical protein
MLRKKIQLARVEIFCQNLKGPRPCFRTGTRTTFAPEIKQKHTGSLIKRKKEASGILCIKSIKQEKQYASGANSKKNYEIN